MWHSITTPRLRNLPFLFATPPNQEFDWPQTFPLFDKEKEDNRRFRRRVRRFDIQFSKSMLFSTSPTKIGKSIEVQHVMFEIFSTSQSQKTTFPSLDRRLGLVLHRRSSFLSFGWVAFRFPWAVTRPL